MIVYKRTPGTLFIVTNWEPDPSGGPAAVKTQISISQGEGIELDLLGLYPHPPKENPPSNARGGFQGVVEAT